LRVDIADVFLSDCYLTGTGGHLHNLGVVLTDSTATESERRVEEIVVNNSNNETAPQSSAVSVTRDRLKALCDELKMEECGMLGFRTEVLTKVCTINLSLILCFLDIYYSGSESASPSQRLWIPRNSHSGINRNQHRD
jgi:hypothetical protein